MQGLTISLPQFWPLDMRIQSNSCFVVPSRGSRHLTLGTEGQERPAQVKQKGGAGGVGPGYVTVAILFVQNKGIYTFTFHNNSN